MVAKRKTNTAAVTPPPPQPVGNPAALQFHRAQLDAAQRAAVKAQAALDAPDPFPHGEGHRTAQAQLDRLQTTIASQQAIIDGLTNRKA